MNADIKNADFNPGNAAAAAVRKAREEGAKEPIEASYLFLTSCYTVIQ